MLKNIILPVALIILVTIGTVYFWFDGAPLSFVALPGFLTLGFGSMYISYYLFYKLFPDKRNIALPGITNILSLQERPQLFTKGSIFGGLFALVLTGLGVFSWTILADKYKSYQLNNFGKDTKSVIIGTGHHKGIGTYREYQFSDSTGKIYSGKFANKSLSAGDTILIRFSTERPIINQVISAADED